MSLPVTTYWRRFPLRNGPQKKVSTPPAHHLTMTPAEVPPLGISTICWLTRSRPRNTTSGNASHHLRVVPLDLLPNAKLLWQDLASVNTWPSPQAVSPLRLPSVNTWATPQAVPLLRLPLRSRVDPHAKSPHHHRVVPINLLPNAKLLWQDLESVNTWPIPQAVSHLRLPIVNTWPTPQAVPPMRLPLHT
jgi:hypothetical protein